MEHISFVVDENLEGLRLDKAITESAGPLISRSFLQKINRNCEFCKFAQN